MILDHRKHSTNKAASLFLFSENTHVKLFHNTDPIVEPKIESSRE